MSTAFNADSGRETRSRNYRIAEEAFRLLSPLVLLGLAVAVANWVSAAAPPEIGGAMTELGKERPGFRGSLLLLPARHLSMEETR